MGCTGRSGSWDQLKPWLAGRAPSQLHVGVSGVRAAANTQGIFTHAQEQAGKTNSLWQLRMVLSFPSAVSWEMGSILPHLQATGRAKATSSNPKSCCKAKTPLRPTPAGAAAPLSRGEAPGGQQHSQPTALLSQALTGFFLQSPLGPGSNLEASAPNHPGLQELKKNPIRDPGSCKHKSI